jgi:TPP-dependent pyruvate/acetoin dehydrogenase alpha subunit
MSGTTWSEERPPEDFYQILDSDGTLIDDPPEVDDEELLDWYRVFVGTRTVEEKMLNMQRSGEASLVTQSKGEEATPLGAAAALAPDDWIFHTYRQHPAQLYWETPMARVIANTMGFAPETINENLDDPETPVTFSPDYTPVGVNVTNAVGTAMADMYNDRETVTLVFVGDGSTSEGSFHDGMNFAGIFDPPVVIICQNNQWAISEPSQRQTGAGTFAQKGEAYGVPHERVDGNDVLAVYETTKNAVEAARDNGGPTFIECVTYRMGNHNTSDNADLYRDEEEQKEYWKDRDPVDRFETYLQDEGILDDETKSEIEDEAEEEVSDAVDTARNIPDTEPERMFDHHLHETPWYEHHQRAELQREMNGENPFTDFTGEGFDE